MSIFKKDLWYLSAPLSKAPVACSTPLCLVQFGELRAAVPRTRRSGKAFHEVLHPAGARRMAASPTGQRGVPQATSPGDDAAGSTPWIVMWGFRTGAWALLQPRHHFRAKRCCIWTSLGLGLPQSKAAWCSRLIGRWLL